MKKYLTKNRVLFTAYLLIAAVSSFLGAYFAFILSEFIDLAAKGQSEGFLAYSLYTIAVVAGTILIEFLCNFVKLKIVRNSKRDLKNDLFKKVIGQNLAAYEKKNSAEYISLLTTKIDMYEDSYFTTLLSLPVTFFSFTFSVFATIYINPYMLILMLILGVVMFVATKRVSKILEVSSKDYMNEVNIHTGFIKDSFTGIRLIKNHLLEQRILENYAKKNKAVEDKKNKHKTNMVICNMVGYFVGMMGTLLVCMVAAWLSINGLITPGSILALSQLSGKIMSPMMSISNIIVGLKSSKVVTKEFEQILAMDVADEKKEPTVLSDKPVITTKMLCFGYDDEKQILQDINCTFEYGKKYCFVGQSGSGKSTLLMLLQGMYDSYKGEILLDNQTLHGLDRESVCKTIGMVSQDVFLFDDTVRNNITLFGDYPDAQIDKAIREAKLDEYIKELPDGVETLISENGKNMSGGQRTRINLARVLLKDYPVLLLDEFTAALDNELAYTVEKSLLENSTDTVISVSHKLTKEIMELYDEILVMKNGRIAEQGNFKELIDRQGIFYSLYTLS